MIFDEVMTGFRITEVSYWEPPAVSRGGSRPVHLREGHRRRSSDGGAGRPRRADGAPGAHRAVYHAGTLSGNPVAMAAGAATLENADAAVYAHLDETARTVADALTASLTAAGVDHSLQKVGNLFSVAFGTSESGVSNYAQAGAQEAFRYGPFFHAMLDAGVYLPPSVFEAWFVSAAHDEAAVDRILEALPTAAKAAAQAY